MGIGGFIKELGGFFAGVFSGLVKVFMEDFENVAKQIVGLLLLADMSGSQKFETALAVLAGHAAKKGKKFINHAARLLIEMELTEAKGDDLEKIVDEGLEAARLAVEAVNESDLANMVKPHLKDGARRFAAVEKLRKDLIAVGKTRLTKSRILHVLIELAVASIKK